MSKRESALRRVMHGDYLPVAFIGSGVSVNCPDWYLFIKKIAELARNNQALQAINGGNHHLDLETLLMIADDSIENINRSTLFDYLNTTFVDKDEVPSVFHAIVRAPFAFYITTNYDNNIERAYKESRGQHLRVVLPDNIEEALVALRDDEPFVLKIHGCARKGASCVIGREHYRNTIYNNRHVRYVLAAILATRPIVFLGYGQRDPHVTRYFDYERSILPHAVMQRFAFVQRNNTNVVMESYLRRLNVSCIEMDKWDDLKNILEQCEVGRQ